MSVELPQTVQESVPVDTIDGDVGMSTSLARSLARKMYLSGFAFLPWMWFVNVWFFWPHINGNDRVLKKCEYSIKRRVTTCRIFMFLVRTCRSSNLRHRAWNCAQLRDFMPVSHGDSSAERVSNGEVKFEESTCVFMIHAACSAIETP
eukprot:1189702-Prorocentrum_minimum.AAC.4